MLANPFLFIAFPHCLNASLLLHGIWQVIPLSCNRHPSSPSLASNVNMLFVGMIHARKQIRRAYIRAGWWTDLSVLNPFVRVILF
jgi:hypothetical protein